MEQVQDELGPKGHTLIEHAGRETHTDVPDTGAVVEKGVGLANLFDVLQIPHVHAVVIVHHCQLQELTQYHHYSCGHCVP